MTQRSLGVILLSALLFTQSAWAVHTTIIGGLRSGLAFGLTGDHHLTDRSWGRFGVEGTTGEDMAFTGDNPLLLFGDLRYYLLDVGPRQVPTSLGLGVVGNFGNRTEIGTCFSVMFEQIYGIEQLCLELGLDYYGDHGHVTAQLGSRIL
jgi:hypothetical protein